jgi:CYTH domain-containing protein
MQEEFELTFLAKELPNGFSKDIHSKEILDIYIPQSSEHPILRIRKNGDLYEITKKQPVSENDPSHQTENTIPLSEEEFKTLSDMPGKRLRKIRYYYSENGIDYEVDVFKDALEGLVLVDVEFKSNAEKELFQAPTWTLVDVTKDKFIAGGMLCGKSYSDIEQELQSLNYKKIIL